MMSSIIGCSDFLTISVETKMQYRRKILCVESAMPCRKKETVIHKKRKYPRWLSRESSVYKSNPSLVFLVTRENRDVRCSSLQRCRDVEINVRFYLSCLYCKFYAFFLCRSDRYKLFNTFCAETSSFYCGFFPGISFPSENVDMSTIFV